VTGTPPGDSLGRRPAGPAETGRHPEGRAAQPLDIPPGEVRYETHDIKPGKVLRALAGLVVTTIVVVAALYPAFLYFRSRAARTDPPPPPLGQHQPGRQAPEPRLQQTPVQDLAAIRAEDERLLATYGWVDEEAGTVHIPIQEAMRLLAARGLAPAAASGAGPGPTAPASPGASPGASPSAPPAGGRR
jgi:hypothetical protein